MDVKKEIDLDASSDDDDRDTDNDPLNILSVKYHQSDTEENSNDSQYMLQVSNKDKNSPKMSAKKVKKKTRQITTVENKCAICLKEFTTRPDFIAHAQQYHPNDKCFKCSLCSKTFVNIISISRHRREHKNMTKKHVCEYCSKAFMHGDTLKRHVETHIKEAIFSCHICDKTFKQKHGLEYHAKIHSRPQGQPQRPEKRYGCEECPRCFVDEISLKRHAEVHTRESIYPCNFCARSFKQKTSLENHERKHMPAKICKKKNRIATETDITDDDDTEKSEDDINTEELQKLPTTDNSDPKCSQQKPTVDKSSSSAQLQIQDLLALFKKNESIQSKNLDNANATRKDPTIEQSKTVAFAVDRKCAVCNEEFNSRLDLVKHAQEYHPNAKAFKCNVCLMAFTNVHSVARHRKIHKTNVKKSLCPYCTKEFLHKDDFKRHLKVHYKKLANENQYPDEESTKSPEQTQTIQDEDDDNDNKDENENNDNDYQYVSEDIMTISKSHSTQEDKDQDSDDNEQDNDIVSDDIMTTIKEEPNLIIKTEYINDEQLLQVINNDGEYWSEIDDNAEQLEDTSNAHESEIIQNLKPERKEVLKNLQNKSLLTVDLKCAICHKNFEFRQDLVEHARLNHAKQRAFKCIDCPLRFKNIISIYRHSRLHKASPAVHTCPHCFKTFTQEESLQHHLRLHTKYSISMAYAVDRKCAICHQEFQLRLDLIKHAKQHHPKMKAFKCSVCSKAFTNIHYVSRHRRLHKNQPNKSKSYACEICSKTFASRQTCKRHIRSHTSEATYACSFCEKTFEIKLSLKMHLKTHSKSDRKDGRRRPRKSLAVLRKCAVCQQEFDYRDDLVEHVRVNHPDSKAFECSICSMLFENVASIYYHQFKYHKKIPKGFECKFCTLPFPTPDELEDHCDTHNKLRPYSCLLCDKTYKRKDALKLHRRFHSEQEYEDIIKKKLQDRNKNLNRKSDDEDEDFEDEDNMNLLKLFNMKNEPNLDSDSEANQKNDKLKNVYGNYKSNAHINDILQGSKRLINMRAIDTKCGVCHKDFKFRRDLIQHAKISHPNGKAFKCNTCSMLFKNIHAVENHRKIHTKSQQENGWSPAAVEKKCAVCQKVFHTRKELLEHCQLNHPNEKPFKCTICPMVFNNITDVPKHRRTHAKGTKLYQCIPCSQIFTEKQYYQRHLGTLKHQYAENLYAYRSKKGHKVENVDIKPKVKSQINKIPRQQTIKRLINMRAVDTKCGICHKDFNYRRDLIQHVKTSHPNAKAFKCNVCSMLFSNVHSIASHRRIHKKFPQKNVWSTATIEKKCAVCQKFFYSRKELEEHGQLYHPNEKPYKCSICPLVFKNINDVPKHRRTHTKGSKLYECVPCSEIFTERQYYQRHLETLKHRDSEEFYELNKINKQKSNINQNLLEDEEHYENTESLDGVNIKEEHYSDDESTEDILDVANLLEISKTEYTYDENIIDAVTNSNDGDPKTSANPKENDVSITESPMRNKETNIDLKNKSNESLEYVVKDYSNDNCIDNSLQESCLPGEAGVISEPQKSKTDLSNKHVCDICHEYFISATHLRRHYSKHTDERPFECCFCEKSYKRKDDMRTHQRKCHPNEKIFKKSINVGATKDASCKYVEKSVHLKGNQKEMISAKNMPAGSLMDLEVSKTEFVHNETISYQINHNIIDSSCIEMANDSEYTAEIIVDDPIAVVKTYEEYTIDIKDELNSDNESQDEGQDLLPNNACHICGREFSNIYILRRHMSKHTTERPHICSFCGKKFKHFYAMKLHQKNSHFHQLLKDNNEEDKLKAAIADLCNEKSSNSDDLQQMSQNLDDDDDYDSTTIGDNVTVQRTRATDRTCGVCEKEFLFRIDLVKHVQKFHPNAKAFKCMDCTKLFRNVESIARHRREHREMAETKTCIHCFKTFNRMDYYKEHIKKHRYIHFLEKAKKREKKKLQKTMHFRSNDDNSVESNLIDINYNPTSSRRSSRRLKEETVKSAIECISGDSNDSTAFIENNTIAFKEIENEITHLEGSQENNGRQDSDSESLNEMDPIENESDKSTAEYRKNQQQYFRKPPMLDNKCAICHQSFDFQRDLVNHAKQFHPNENALKCRICEFYLSNMSSVSHHFKTHKKIPSKYYCKLCPKSFAYKTYLKCHMIQHKRSSNSLYTCSICNKNYRYKGNLVVHNENVHGAPKKVTCMETDSLDAKTSDVNDSQERDLILDNIREAIAKFKPRQKLLNATKCPICKMDLFRRLDFEEHIEKFHRDYRAFKCQQCNEGFFNSKNLLTHVKTTH